MQPGLTEFTRMPSIAWSNGHGTGQGKAGHSSRVRGDALRVAVPCTDDTSTMEPLPSWRIIGRRNRLEDLILAWGGCSRWVVLVNPRRLPRRSHFWRRIAPAFARVLTSSGWWPLAKLGWYFPNDLA